LAARKPISAEEIADGLGGMMTQSDIASVYRNLETLGELGLVRHLHAGHGPGRYVLEAFGDREYLACESCGALESVDPAALDGVRAAVRGLSGFEVRFSHLPIVGLCPRCAKQRRTTPGERSPAGAELQQFSRARSAEIMGLYRRGGTHGLACGWGQLPKLGA